MKADFNLKAKPQYGMASNVAWMIGIAWRVRRRVLLICVLTALFEVLYSAAQLYVAPEILALVEAHASIERLLFTILFFTAALFFTLGAKQYLDTNAMYPRIDVRWAILSMISDKCNTTSFPNTLDASFIQMRDKAGYATDNNREATEYIWQGMTNLLKDIGGFLVCLSILTNLNPVLVIVVIMTCLIGFWAARYANNWKYEHRKEESAYYAKKRYIRDQSQSVTLAKDIRIFGLQDWLNDLLEDVHNVYLAWRLKVERKELAAGITEAVMAIARNGIAYVYLISLALQDGMSVSSFVLYFSAISTFSSWVLSILKDMARMHKDSLDISAVREFLEYPEPFRFEEGEPVPASTGASLRAANSNRYASTPCEIRLEHVSYRYPGADADTLHDISLVIHPGEKVAIVGLNGAGKSTLIRLLCGLFDPTEGRVLLNGKDIRDFNRKSYYAQISAVFQEYSLLDVTVAENVAQMAEGIDVDRVRNCLEKAGMKKVIEELPDELDAHVGRDVYLDGVLFSGGQTQRLMLARALYKDAPILMLDEPTAALDPIAENDIYMKYSEMTQGKTSVFISHRLASTRFCDRILFIADGRIAEEGTHESLLALGGEYAKLFEVQSRYYKEGRDF